MTHEEQVRSVPSGPIRLSANHRTFVTSDNKPFFWLGDTAWAMFVKYPKDKAEAYLDNRAKKGFTVIQAVLGWSEGTGSEAASPSANPFGHKPWINDDPALPNDKFFEYVDHLLDYAKARGLVVAVLLLEAVGE